MSPLLFLAIAVVVPLLGMAVLGVGARMKHNRVTDDETEPFRRRLNSIAPRDPQQSSRMPGLVGLFRRAPKPSNRGGATADGPQTGTAGPRPRTAKSIRLIEREFSLPRLPPLSAERDERPSRPRHPRRPAHEQGNRSAT